MTSIQESISALGRTGYTVHWQQTATGHGRQRNFLNLDEATGFFYSCEETAAAWRTVDTAERCATWSLQELIWFFLGYRYEKLIPLAFRSWNVKLNSRSGNFYSAAFFAFIH